MFYIQVLLNLAEYGPGLYNTFDGKARHLDRLIGGQASRKNTTQVYRHGGIRLDMYLNRKSPQAKGKLYVVKLL